MCMYVCACVCQKKTTFCNREQSCTITIYSGGEPVKVYPSTLTTTTTTTTQRRILYARSVGRSLPL